MSLAKIFLVLSIDLGIEIKKLNSILKQFQKLES